MPSISPLFTAIILAGDRKPDDPVARAAGVEGKALTPVGGIPMVVRVLRALEASKTIDGRILCGPPREALKGYSELESRIASHQLQWMEPQATPSLSAYHVLQSIPETTPVLLTTADHALLTNEIVEYFCASAIEQACDLAVAFASYDLVSQAYPGIRRTAIRLRDGAYCTCNLFAFVAPRARKAAHFWRRVEQDRKRPWKVISAFGWLSVLQYVLGRLSLSDGLARVSTTLGLTIRPVILPYPQAAVDVDTMEDLAFVEEIVKQQTWGRNGEKRKA